MLHAFNWNLLAWIAWGLLILALRYRVERRQQKIDEQRQQKALEA
jgi:heme exporter protein C